ncbi:MAG: hypothetical protein LC114_23360 [Bryobacterales bacterium]|nr:hypothetical protein [Bryobacterales bacterium]
MSDVSRLIVRLRDLRLRLETFEVGLEKDFMALDVAWERLDTVWDGYAYQEFVQQWQQTRAMFKGYTDLAYKYEGFLRERIEALEKFERSGGL